MQTYIDVESDQSEGFRLCVRGADPHWCNIWCRAAPRAPRARGVAGRRQIGCTASVRRCPPILGALPGVRGAGGRRRRPMSRRSAV